LIIALAHGVLGFGNPAGVPIFANYFNGVAAHLRSAGHTVIAPQVNPVGTVVQRGEQLAAAIVGQLPRDQRIHVIAHSMGGLDARHAITHVADVAERVATLVTIGTPHRGSPVADAIASRTEPLLEHIPRFIVDQLQRNAGALRDLTTAIGTRFDDATPDVPGVRYIEVAGDASLGGQELLLFRLSAAIGQLTGESTTESSPGRQRFATATSTWTTGRWITLVRLDGAWPTPYHWI
jgi:triacylglycerol lipase